MIVVMASGMAVARADSYFFDFNSGSSQVATDFTVNSGSPFTYLPTGGIGGIGGTGAIEHGGGTDQTALVYNLSIANALGTEFVFSLDFQGGNQSVSTRGHVMAVGLLSGNTSWISGSAGDYNLRAGIALNNSSSFNLTQFRTLNNSPSVGAGATMKSIVPMLTTDQWYRYTATFTNVGTGFSINASLYDLGADGLSSASLIDSASSTVTAPELAADNQVYFGIHGGTKSTETTFAKSLDNFSVTVTPVPEPHSLALLSAGAALFAILLRRRQVPR